jgi:hypothetical protein
MDAPMPELTIDWRHDGFQVIRIFVQDPLDQPTRERLMATVMTFRDMPDLASLRSAAEAIARDTGLKWTFLDGPDHTNPFGDWVTIGFRRPFALDAWGGDAGFGR